MLCRPRLPIVRFPYRSLRRLRTLEPKPAVKNAWTDEKLVPTEKYPLSIALTSHPKTIKRDKSIGAPVTKTKLYVAKGDALHSRVNQIYIRTQIVSPDLCDDIINYLGHTLEQHKGCDILDLHPGVGLWSQKIHEFLQPRSHILLEPSEMYDSYLKPLVEQPGSTYKLYRDDPTRFETYATLVEGGVFPHQKRVNAGDADAAKLNTSLLVIGSLMWDPMLPGFGFSSMARQMITKFVQGAWRLEGMHAFGPVRSLLWGTQEEMRGPLPKSVAHVGKYNQIFATQCDITEYATTSRSAATLGPKQFGRRPQYDMESAVKALERGRQSGVKLPEHRRDSLHQFADELTEVTGGTGKISSAELREFLKAKQYEGISTVGLSNPGEIAYWEEDKKLQKERKALDLEAGKKLKHMDDKAHVLRRGTVKRSGVVLSQVEAAAIVGEEIYDLECMILSLPDGLDKDKALTALKDKENEYEAAVERINKNFRSAVPVETDDRLILRSPVPRLQWESRPYEPLTIQADEVWPIHQVSLLDLMPRPPPPDMDLEWWEWVDDFYTVLFSSPGISVREAMNLVQPGADSLLDEVPSLKDPMKGGRLNMDHFRVRMLTHEMIVDLCRAYKEWPFRPPESKHKKYFQLRAGKSNKRTLTE
ncbi:hypothetical protein DM02DRAFT_609419 [Periconia macrospinosa]|uniref:Mitochondrial transcription factor 1 n=1 Tax=Periconia macrospinosa TaxID=97972 RepID=A0A2V1ECR8_9PLEO|nr:hypothetical protein DM02DRAFT_609419 [Periconia macrospinosa]